MGCPVFAKKGNIERIWQGKRTILAKTDKKAAMDFVQYLT